MESKLISNNPIIRYQNIIFVIMLMATTFVLHQSVGESFWRWDDPIILKCAIEHTPLEYFFIPENYRCLTGSHVTPWLLFSFDLDFGLLGLFSQGFYWHHLFSLSLVSVASFWLLKLYIRPLLAFMGLMLFIVGSPVWVVAQQLMTRHYVEGLIFAILALYWYIFSLRKNQMAYAVIGGFFYMLATLAKEIYVPLVGILLFIPEANLKKRLSASLPYFLWSIAYVFYRNYMLGNFMGGYHSDYSLQLLIANFIRAPELVVGSGYAEIILIMVWLVSLVLLVKSRWLIVSYSLVLFLPLLPLFSGGLLDYRFLFLPYWSFCVLLAVLMNHLLINYRVTIYLLLPILVFFTFKVIDVTLQTQKTVYLYIAEIEEQGKFYWHHTDKEKFLLVTPNLAATSWYFMGLTWIKANVLHQSMPSLLFNTSFDTKVNNQPVIPNLWQYEPDCLCVEKLSAEKLNTWFIDNQGQNTSQAPRLVPPASTVTCDTKLPLLEVNTANKEAAAITTQYQTAGGAAVNGGLFKQLVTVQLADRVEVRGVLCGSSEVVGQAAEIVVYADYQPLDSTQDQSHYMLDSGGKVQPWDEKWEHLVALKPTVIKSKQEVSLYHNVFPVTGEVKLSFGYRLAKGTIVKNAKRIVVKIKP